MTEITTQDWEAYVNLVDYEFTPNPEPDQPSDLYFVTATRFATGEVLERFTCEAPHLISTAAYEAQEYTLEERLGPYGLEWQREQQERMGR